MQPGIIAMLVGAAFLVVSIIIKVVSKSKDRKEHWEVVTTMISGGMPRKNITAKPQTTGHSKRRNPGRRNQRTHRKQISFSDKLAIIGLIVELIGTITQVVLAVVK